MQIALNIFLKITIKNKLKFFELLKPAILHNIHAFYVLENSHFLWSIEKFLKIVAAFLLNAKKVSCAIQSGLFLESLSNTSTVLIKSWPRVPAGTEEGVPQKDTLGERAVTRKGLALWGVLTIFLIWLIAIWVFLRNCFLNCTYAL